MVLKDLKDGYGFKYFTSDRKIANIAFKLSSDLTANLGFIVPIRNYFAMHPNMKVYDICKLIDLKPFTPISSVVEEVTDKSGHIVWTGRDFGYTQRLLVTEHKYKSSKIVAILDEPTSFNLDMNVFDIGPIELFNGFAYSTSTRPCPNCMQSFLSDDEDLFDENFSTICVCKNCGCQVGINISDKY